MIESTLCSNMLLDFVFSIITVHRLSDDCPLEVCVNNIDIRMLEVRVLEYASLIVRPFESVKDTVRWSEHSKKRNKKERKKDE